MRFTTSLVNKETESPRGTRQLPEIGGVKWGRSKGKEGKGHMETYYSNINQIIFSINDS